MVHVGTQGGDDKFVHNNLYKA